MGHKNLTVAALLVFAATSSAVRAAARDPTLAAIHPDNSRVNKDFALPTARTADDQPNDRQDRLTAARVRRVIIRDDTLSVYAHNVKIIVMNGKLTLEGPVHCDLERQELALDAATVLDPASITNNVTVA
jgi:hypothetical protein